MLARLVCRFRGHSERTADLKEVEVPEAVAEQFGIPARFVVESLSCARCGRERRRPADNPRFPSILPQ